MKKLLSLAVMVVFITGMALAQNPPAKKTAEKKEAKTEMKTDTTKKVMHHKVQPKKAEKKK